MRCHCSWQMAWLTPGPSWFPQHAVSGLALTPHIPYMPPLWSAHGLAPTGVSSTINPPCPLFGCMYICIYLVAIKGCWALQTTFDPMPGIPQEHDSTPRRLSSVYPRQATHVLFTKNGPVESECELNNVNPHIIRNQIQNQIEVTLNEDKYCKWCHYHTNTEF